MQLKHLVLYDAGGLWGGNNVYLSSDGTVWVQIVSPPPPGGSGLYESRYKFALQPGKVAELQKLLADHHFADIRIKEHPGIPDEGRPAIRVTPVNGAAVKKQKWAADKNADFDAIYQWLVALVPKPGTEKPIMTGPVDFNWMPPGFGS